METIIITDVTRFKPAGNKLCVAGLTLDGRTCIRPMLPGELHPDYLTYSYCKANNILPGMIMSGDFVPPQKISAPHHEDRIVSSQAFHEPSTPEVFENLLRNSLSPSVSAGFGVTSTADVITPEDNPKCSIITIEPRPGTVKVVQDQFQTDRVKIHFVDYAGVSYNFRSITDLGLYDFVGNPVTRKMTVDEINNILNTNRVYLRIGLSRFYEEPGGRKRQGYWIQVNGVYSFPGYSQIIRSY